MMKIFKKLIERIYKRSEDKNKVSVRNKEQKKSITLGYCLDDWTLYSNKTLITMDISPENNSHLLIVGGSGSGKTYALQEILARLALAEPEGMFYFCDYKGDKSFKYLRKTARYFSYKQTFEILKKVHELANKRFSGEDTSTEQITLIIDEYLSFVSSFSVKKEKEDVLRMIAEILQMGRSMGVRLVVCTQTAYASAFPEGVRVNFDYIMVLGSFHKATYDMLFGEYDSKIKNKKFNQGEGTALINRNELRFIKVPTVSDFNRLKDICIRALQ